MWCALAEKHYYLNFAGTSKKRRNYSMTHQPLMQSCQGYASLSMPREDTLLQ